MLLSSVETLLQFGDLICTRRRDFLLCLRYTRLRPRNRERQRKTGLLIDGSPDQLRSDLSLSLKIPSYEELLNETTITLGRRKRDFMLLRQFPIDDESQLKPTIVQA